MQREVCRSPASSARRSATVVLPDDEPPATPIRNGRAGQRLHRRRDVTAGGARPGGSVATTMPTSDGRESTAIDDSREGHTHDRRTRGPAEGRAGARAAAQPARRRQRSPVGSTLSIVLAVIAVIAGFLILRAITDDDDGGDDAGDDHDDAGHDEPGTTRRRVTGSTTRRRRDDGPPRLPVRRRRARRCRRQRQRRRRFGRRHVDGPADAGYTMGEPGNTTATLDASVVYYVAGDAAAQAVATPSPREMGGLQVEPSAVASRRSTRVSARRPCSSWSAPTPPARRWPTSPAPSRRRPAPVAPVVDGGVSRVRRRRAPSRRRSLTSARSASVAACSMHQRGSSSARVARRTRRPAR